MIAAWMLFAFATGGALSAAAAAAERLARAAGRPRRGVWAVALVATAGWPVAAGVATLAAGTRAPDEAAAVAAGAYRLPALTVPTFGDAAPGLDAALLAAWGLASAGLLTRLAASGAALRRWRRAWPTRDVDGVRVRVAPDVGPAVVGLRPMEVVLPAWALALGGAERVLVLRHEAEHRAARDPYLLLLAALLTALAPWHPALWWQARRLRLAVELDCDARVLRAHPRPAPYARLLLTIAQRRGPEAPRLAPAPLALSALPSHLERRITAMRSAARPSSRLHRVALGTLVLAAVAVACAVESPDRSTGPRASAAARSRAAADSPAAVAATAEFLEFQVEEPAAAVPGSIPVRYPDALRTAGPGGRAVSGRVDVQFVVDTSGRVEPNTIKVLRSTHPAFSAAAQAALPAGRFRPARVGGRAVRQLVQLPVGFSPDP